MPLLNIVPHPVMFVIEHIFCSEYIVVTLTTALLLLGELWEVVGRFFVRGSLAFFSGASARRIAVGVVVDEE